MSKKRASRKAKEETDQAEGNGNYDESFPCKFGKASTGKNSVSIGIKVDLSALPLTKAHKLFASSELAVRCEADPNARGDTPGQSKMDFGTGQSFEGTARVTGYRTTKDQYSASLQFACNDDEWVGLGAIADCVGTMQASRTGDAAKKRGRPRKDEGLDDAEDDES